MFLHHSIGVLLLGMGLRRCGGQDPIFPDLFNPPLPPSYRIHPYRPPPIPQRPLKQIKDWLDNHELTAMEKSNGSPQQPSSQFVTYETGNNNHSHNHTNHNNLIGTQQVKGPRGIGEDYKIQTIQVGPSVYPRPSPVLPPATPVATPHSHTHTTPNSHRQPFFPSKNQLPNYPHNSIQEPEKYTRVAATPSVPESSTRPAHVYSNEPLSPVVRTTVGLLQGRIATTSNGFRMRAFLNVPYAERPGRFKKTEPKQPWTGIYNATEFGPQCVQDGAVGWGEDCLLMVILAPTQPATPLPVLFLPPGGGFVSGGYKSHNIDSLGQNFVAREVLLVIPNYRVGGYGFWSTQTAEAPGNYGLWDILTALVFVKQNIGAFGGDPNRITLWGQGTGAVAVSALTLSPLTVGLYQNAILMDGNVFDPRIHHREKENTLRYQDFAQAAGCDDRGATRWKTAQKYRILACLQSKQPEQILQAQKESNMSGKFMWHPVVDGPGGILPESFDVLASKRPNTPIVMGNSRDVTAWELLVRPTMEEWSRRGERGRLDLPNDFQLINHPLAVKEQCETYITTATYNNPIGVREMCKLKFASTPAYVPDRADYWFRQAVKVGSSFAYHGPTIKDAHHHLSKGNHKVYLFSFDLIRSEGSPRSWWETVGSFFNLDKAFTEEFFPGDFYRFGLTPRDEYVKSIFIEMIVNFAKSGDDPSPTDPAIADPRLLAKKGDRRRNANDSKRKIEWEPMRLPKGYNYLSINEPAEMKDYFNLDEVMFWNQFTPLITELEHLSQARNQNQHTMLNSPHDVMTNEHSLETRNANGNPIWEWMKHFFPPGVVNSYRLNPKKKRQ